MEIKEIKSTSVNPYVGLFESQREKAQLLRSASINDRKEKLRSIKRWVLSNSNLIVKALYADFKKPEVEVFLTEIQPIVAEANHAIKNLHRWTKPKRVPAPLTLLGTTSHIHVEPKGVCLIIAPWNFPFMLTILPLVEAISAGNTAIVKPSELTPHTSQVLYEMIAELFEEEEVKVVQGEVEVAKQLLELPFNHIFFTGSPAVGKIVMKAASQNLTSVTLELGGKSPVIIDETANLKDAAAKLAWGKFMNCGQTCIAPDYLYVHASVIEAFILEFKNYLKKEFYNNERVNKDDYARIVNDKHFKRLSSLLEDVVETGGKIVYGGSANFEERLIEPTLVTGLSGLSKVMQEEIFGPILPILPYSSLDEIIVELKQKPRPLALYHFTKSKTNTKKIVAEIPAGGVCVNESVLHFTNVNLPFGGINNSGIGKSHGYFGFLAFSNQKPVLKQRIGFTPTKLLFPPYNDLSKSLTKLIAKYL